MTVFISQPTQVAGLYRPWSGDAPKILMQLRVVAQFGFGFETRDRAGLQARVKRPRQPEAGGAAELLPVCRVSALTSPGRY